MLDAPKYYVIGYPRTGTTSLYSYILRNVHGLKVGSQKLTNYHERQFNEIRKRNPDRWQNQSGVFNHGVYCAAFEGGADAPAVDLSPSYVFDPTAIDSIASSCKDAVVIVILRYPPTYIRSMAWNLKANGYIESYRDLEAISESTSEEYNGFPRAMIDVLSHLRMTAILSPWLESFDNVKILLYENLYADVGTYGMQIDRLFETEHAHRHPSVSNTASEKRVIGENYGGMRKVLSGVLPSGVKGFLRSYFGRMDEEETLLDELLSRNHDMVGREIETLRETLVKFGHKALADEISTTWVSRFGSPVEGSTD